MRQRRHTLQVNTFPFLAVLLCAMGSLILLMLVIDRRARVVARAKALKAAQLAVSEDRKSRAELEERRRRLREQLVKDDQSVAAEVQSIRRQMDKVAGALRIEEQRGAALRQGIETEKSQLSLVSEELIRRQGAQAQAAGQNETAQAELARLTNELMQMERTLSDLKEYRKRQQQTFSLVPYQGKRGDNRRPIYIECAARGIVIHPGRSAFEGLRFVAHEIRAEIERQVARNQVILSSTTDNRETNVYLLMLIRPNGITTYYKTLAMLQGMSLDFGYEFIDSDWVLDFSDEPASEKQPWMQAELVPRLTGSASAAKGIAGIQAFPANGLAYPGQGEKTGIREGRAGPSGTNGLSAENGKGLSDGGIIAQLPVTLGARRLGPPAASGDSFPDEKRVGVLPGGSTNEPSVPRSDQPGGTERQTNESWQVREASARPTAGDLTSATVQSPNKAGPLDATIGAPQGISTPSAGSNPNATGEAAPTQTPSGAANNPQLAGVKAASASPSSSGPGNPEQSAADPSNAGAGLPRDPLSRLMPGETKKTASRPLPFAGLLNSNRDWIISIECRADAVVLYPSRQRISAAEFATTKSDHNPLRESIEQMIQRRQASLRAGEMPYRPMIRFRVRPEGARTYYMAYPILESLGVPMTRENVEAENKHD
jgi:hypothetical protein